MYAYIYNYSLFWLRSCSQGVKNKEGIMENYFIKLRIVEVDSRGKDCQLFSFVLGFLVLL